MPKLEYPAFFEHGLVGARIKEDIQHREAFMFVPYKMIMSVKKAQADKVIGQILEKHEDVFSEGEDILCFFIFYELTKGTKSYYWPYLRLMPEIDFA